MVWRVEKISCLCVWRAEGVEWSILGRWFKGFRYAMDLEMFEGVGGEVIFNVVFGLGLKFLFIDDRLFLEEVTCKVS